MSEDNELGKEGDFSLAFYNASTLSAQTFFEELIDLVEDEEIEEVNVKQLMKSEQSIGAVILLPHAFRLLADAYLLFQISRELSEKIDSSQPVIRSEVSELISHMPRISKNVSKTIVKALKYSPGKDMHVEIGMPNGPLIKIDISQTKLLEDKFEVDDEYVPLTSKQFSYLEGLTRSERNDLTAKEYLIKHNRKYLNHLSKREASELIEQLKKK